MFFNCIAAPNAFIQLAATKAGSRTFGEDAASFFA